MVQAYLPLTDFDAGGARIRLHGVPTSGGAADSSVLASLCSVAKRKGIPRRERALTSGDLNPPGNAAILVRLVVAPGQRWG